MDTFAAGARGGAAAFFDLDKTIIARSSTLAFATSFYRHGLITRSQAARGAFAQLRFRAAGADHAQMERVREQLARACRGWSADRVTEIVTANLARAIAPIIYEQARLLLDGHRLAGRDVFIVSAAGQEMVGPIAAMLGVDRIIATRMRRAEGRYTGEMEFYAYGEGKAERIRQVAAEREYDLAACYAYSDSFTDLPMLEAVGYPHAVNPDRPLRRIAADRDWPVLTFASGARPRAGCPEA